jgi:hypothetical protein
MVTIVHELAVGSQFVHERCYLYSDSEGNLSLECWDASSMNNNLSLPLRKTTKAELTNGKLKITNFVIWNHAKLAKMSGILQF